ncbi:hypothetical protein D9758_003032 [Tetrapyrgos nigripes]|uniref:Glutathione transferase n=1 Tax=Tetrapyrgos nigripes TaxID=182062 RepID=A0A8H5LTH7_9AGAR|nr:hypothetical protein D9758_003032 [Tetrapyrgos nigripes]
MMSTNALIIKLPRDLGLADSLSKSTLNRFAYVKLALVSTLPLLVFQTLYSLRTRLKANVPWPRVQAEPEEAEKSFEKMKFNCVQRAHHNTLENLPLIYLTTILTGLKYPVFAASACGLWVLTRIAYTRDYGSGIPSKRNLSARTGIFILWTLIGVSIYSSVNDVLPLLA